ncbi:MAG TPA: DUF418 domain-containing protein [Phycisphaerales bacterium]|nr:DUF418 domain-containing protein [Phycisphaerales bacterium]HMP36910.1 DUF418 domain-containing protein [Phycisphaerales bacterium]
MALLGILFVNLPSFAFPIADAFGPPWPDAGRGEVAAWWFVQAFCQLKFVSLYSLLFGAGMVVLVDRARDSGRGWSRPLRRLAVLLCFGVLHAVFLWHGDILVCYAMMATLLLVAIRLPGAWLAGLGVATLLIGAAARSSWLALHAGTFDAAISSRSEPRPPGDARSSMSDSTSNSGPSSIARSASSSTSRSTASPTAGATTSAATGAAPSAAPVAAQRAAHVAARIAIVSTAGLLALEFPLSPRPESASELPLSWDDWIASEGRRSAEELDRWSAAHADLGPIARVLALGRESDWNPADPLAIAFETQVLRDGPYLDACAFRTVVAAALEVDGFAEWNWHVLALFFLGAGAMRLGFFGPGGRRWRSAMLLLLPIGLVGENWWAWINLRAMAEWDPRLVSWEPWRPFAAVAMMFGYVGAISWALERCMPRVVVASLSAVGRMGLTGYIGESVLAAFVMYSWGLGSYGTWSRVGLIPLALVIYAVIAAFALTWSRRFPAGPLEWLWRRAVDPGWRPPAAAPPLPAPSAAVPGAPPRSRYPPRLRPSELGRRT